MTHYDLCLEADAFVREYPDTAWGPGHVVLADYNWDCIDFCLTEIQKIREGEEHFYEKGISPEELDATEKKLKELNECYEDDDFLP